MGCNVCKVQRCGECPVSCWRFRRRPSTATGALRSLDRSPSVLRRSVRWRYEDNQGLGLTICRRIVKDHSGKICAVSQEGRGSTFYFTLPRTLAEPIE
ncbi:MAG: hypothetical protein IIC50_24170 [Planctomycetes bacterium]|nr:hypothetical protein [Planctomycetota bacterium]